MAKRFQKNVFTAWTTRPFLLFLLPLPLLPAVIVSLARGNLLDTSIHLLAITAFLVGAGLTRRGLVEEAEYHLRKIAKAPRLPKKLLGGIGVSIGTFICSYFSVANSLPFSVFLGVLTLGGCYLRYGFDPREDKITIAESHGYSTEEIVQALEEAERKIAVIGQASRNIQNPELKSRLERIQKLAQQIVAVIEEDPRDLRRARRFLNVYLDGAQRVSEGYARTHQRSQSAELETNFRHVLVTIEEVFAEQHRKLLEHDVVDVDVQIEVLTNQLKRQGVI